MARSRPALLQNIFRIIVPIIEPHGPLFAKGFAYCGLNKNTPKYRQDRQYPTGDHEIIITHSGRGHVEGQNLSNDVKQGDLIIIPMGCPNSYWTSGNFWEFVYFHCLDIGPWKNIGTQRSISVVPSMHEKNIFALMEQYYHHASAPGSRVDEFLPHLAALIALYLEDEIGARNPADRLRHLQFLKLAEHISAHLDRSWPLADMAAFVNLSTSRFVEVSRKYLGISPQHYVSRLRMQCAAQMLQQGIPLKRIAEEVGYSDRFALSKAFRQFFGLSPIRFAKRPF